jgi:heme exporter protein C
MGMDFKDDVYLGLTALINAIAIYFALFLSPADVEMGELVRIFYFHLPPAITTYLTLLISMVTGLLFLRTKEQKFDTISEAGAILGIIYGFITLVGGAIWANATWGVYWNWDPRETTTLIAWLAYVGYFLLRMSVENPERKASTSAAYNALAFMTVPLSYLSFILWPSLHPRLGSEGGLGLTGRMVEALLLNIIGSLLLYFWILWKTYGMRAQNDVFYGDNLK